MRLAALALLIGAFVAIGFGSARADVDSCLQAARAEVLECRELAREAFRTAKDACLERDHDCVDVCRADREDCAETSQIAADLAVCNADREVAVDACRNTTPEDSPERDTCIDAAQVDAFTCRDGAREANKGELKACRADFRSCARACGPPLVRGEARVCRQEAILEFTAAKDACKQDRRLAVDACRKLDHTCVEQCRADRDGCRAPIEAALETAVDTCRAARDEAVDVCRATTADDTPERDACVDAAQLANFQCRDAAREAARPERQACRDSFLSCVEVCPRAMP